MSTLLAAGMQFSLFFCLLTCGLIFSPRTRAALKYFLYGGKEQLDVQRVEDIAGGFQTFRELMAPVEASVVNEKPRSLMDPSTKQALRLVFAPEGSYLQELLLTEVKVVTKVILFG